jgi:hypothetical protein
MITSYETFKEAMAYPVGNHYMKAHDAIAHDKITMFGMEDDKVMAQGSISKKQVDALAKKGINPVKDEDGDLVIKVPYAQYEKIRADFQEEKDAYVKDNKLFKPVDEAEDAVVEAITLSGEYLNGDEYFEKFETKQDMLDAKKEIKRIFAEYLKDGKLDKGDVVNPKSVKEDAVEENAVADKLATQKQATKGIASKITATAEFKAFKAKLHELVNAGTEGIDEHKKGFYKNNVLNLLVDSLYDVNEATDGTADFKAIKNKVTLIGAEVLPITQDGWKHAFGISSADPKFKEYYDFIQDYVESKDISDILYTSKKEGGASIFIFGMN